jgi:hypothetical protein
VLFLGIANVQAQLIRETDERLDKLVLAVEVTGPQMLSLEMKQELKLSPEQYARIEVLNEQHYRQLADAEMNLTDPILKQRKYRDISLELDKALSSILNEQQLKHFLELEGRQNVSYLSGADEE